MGFLRLALTAGAVPKITPTMVEITRAVTSGLLAIYHQTSGTMTDTNLSAISGLVFILLLVLALFVWVGKNYSAEKQFESLIK